MPDTLTFETILPPATMPVADIRAARIIARIRRHGIDHHKGAGNPDVIAAVRVWIAGNLTDGQFGECLRRILKRNPQLAI